MDSVEQKPVNPGSPRFSRARLFGGIGVLVLGILLGGFWGWREKNREQEVTSPASSGVLGDLEERAGGAVQGTAASTEEGSALPQGEDIQVSLPPQPPSPPVALPPPSPPPKSQPSVMKPVSVCEQAKKELAGAQESIRKDYERAAVAAKTAYDEEQLSVSRQLTELQRQRNEAINNYLTAIAITTSKYNSATTTSAYEIYQQEQRLALESYTQVITRISTEELPLLEQKKTSQAAYEEVLQARASKKDQDLAAAQVVYEAKGCR